MKEVIVAFDKFLTDRKLSFEAILIGGAVHVEKAFNVLKKALDYV